MWTSVFLVAVLFGTAQSQTNEAMRAYDRSRIIFLNTGKPVPVRPTAFDVGYEYGRILNLHYFPALELYNAGRYSEAEENLSYLLERPDYINGNSRQQEFMSAAFYTRAMIYLYHVSGIGRYSLAKEDFEASLKWNAKNFLAYLELSRVYSSLGFKEQAISILKYLLQLEPGKEIAAQAQDELRKLTTK
jgi:tetratricopeptide (TPR) repeat protein